MPIFLVTASLESEPAGMVLFLVEAALWFESEVVMREWMRTHDTVTRLDGSPIASSSIAWLGCKEPRAVEPANAGSYLFDGRAL